MRILLAGSYSYFWYEETCAQALERLGHDVNRYQWGGMFKSRLGRFQHRLLIGTSILQLNQDLISHACAIRPDVIFLWRGVPVWPTTLEKLKKKTGAMLVSYNNDDPFGPSSGRVIWRHFIKCIPVYDINFVYRRVNIAEYYSAGAQQVEVLLPYYIPAVHRPVNLTAEEQASYTCDIVFIGHYEDDGRVDYLRALVEAGLHVRLYGGIYWSKKNLGDLADYFGPIVPVYGSDYVKALSGAKLCLVFLSRLNRDTYTRRCFEIPACNGLMLSERTHDLLTFYREDTEAVFFSTPNELVSKAKILLADDEKRHQIAKAGRRRCLEDGHDVMSRMKQLSNIVTRG